MQAAEEAEAKQAAVEVVRAGGVGAGVQAAAVGEAAMGATAVQAAAVQAAAVGEAAVGEEPVPILSPSCSIMHCVWMLCASCSLAGSETQGERQERRPSWLVSGES